MDYSSLELLEFPKICATLAQYTSFSVSHDLVLSLMPSAKPEEVRLRLKQSTEARHLLSMRLNFSIGEITDVREPVKVAAKGKVLDPEILNSVKDAIAASRVVRSSLAKLDAEVPELWNIAKGIFESKDLEHEIGRCITRENEISDGASKKLQMIRAQLTELRQRLTDKLDSILRSKDKQKFIQEPYITERESRYVIPVKSDFKKDIKGIVHDFSNTGATVFIEPWETVEMGNDLRQLAIEEKQEIERILLELSQKVGADEIEICTNVELLAEIDVALAKAAYAEQTEAAEPAISDSETEQRTYILKLVNARHPLLKGKVVPLTVEIGKDFNILVITGPNAGGKTVALKTVGLLALMAQAGIPIPASEASELPVFDRVYADIGDLQSIEETLSTFSWHISNITNIIRDSTDHSLVLLDELGISTDPEEGAALARAILLKFLAKRSLVVATTHYNDLKVFAHVTDGMQNASMDFDSVTLMPAYRLSIGIPGKSNALSVAERLGLPLEIIENARQMVGKDTQEVEILISDLRKQKQECDLALSEIGREKEAIAKLRNQTESEIHQLKEKEYNLIEQINNRLVQDSSELQKSIRETEAELKKTSRREGIVRAQKAAIELQKEVDFEIKKAKSELGVILPATEQKYEEVPCNGDLVRLKNKIQGTVIAIDKETGRIAVQAGKSKITVDLTDVEKILESQKKVAAQFPVLKKRRSTYTGSSLELDLRGKRADEVSASLDRFLNDAFLSNLQSVRIIHGYATGTVRQIVRDVLATHPLVKSFQPGSKEEGGDGITIAGL